MEKPHLTVISGPRQGLQVSMDVSPFTLGRGADNTLSLPDPTISSHHARIVEHIGLYWLEDLGSTNGTYFLPPRGEEFRLPKDKPVLLVEGARIRLGGHTTLQVEGMVASQQDATAWSLQQLQAFIAGCYEGLTALEPAQRQVVLDDLHRFEEAIRQTNSEAELVHLVAEKLSMLSKTVVGKYEPDESGLPALPEDLPEPDSPCRVPSLHNLFLSNLQRILQELPGQEEEP
jgi:predicted component of type VI protein secretion system